MCRCPGFCNGDPATTVGAHVRLVGVSGMSMKAPDLFIAWACSGCHDFLDGRTPSLVPYSERRLMLLEGMARTQYELIQLGHLNV